MGIVFEVDGQLNLIRLEDNELSNDNRINLRVDKSSVSPWRARSDFSLFHGV